MKHLRFLFWSFLVLITACSAPEEQRANVPAPNSVVSTPAPRPEFPGGEIIDEGNGYAFYLPQSYSPDRASPVVFFFDAHARARLPLERYQPLAEMMGWVLAASTRSQNGQAPALALEHASSMIGTLQQKLNLDGRRMYTGGFSGGARVAALVAQNRVDIAGVLACGAGYQPGQADRFHYVSMVGMEDFNYQEIRSLEQFLETNQRSHLVEYFDGGHEWAPLNTMAKGMQWLHFRAMATGSAPKSDTAAAGMLEKVHYQDRQLQTSGTAYQRWLLRKKAISYLSGLSDITELSREMNEIRASESFQAEMTRKELEMHREMEMRKQYSQALESENLDYWKRVTGMMAKVARNGAREEAWLNQRVLNFLSLSAYMNANAFLKANALPEAERMLQIYALVDPPNPEYAYLSAVLHTRRSRPEAALKALSQAVTLGFDDAGRMENDPGLSSLKQNPGFAALLDSVRANGDKGD